MIRQQYSIGVLNRIPSKYIQIDCLRVAFYKREALEYTHLLSMQARKYLLKIYNFVGKFKESQHDESSLEIDFTSSNWP